MLMTIHRSQAYVWDYNIYLKTNATAEAVQVTQNGKVNEILNGVPDWVYEGNALTRRHPYMSEHSVTPANPSASFLAQQRRFLPPTKPSGGLRRGNIWLIYKLMTLEFTTLNTQCMEMTSTPPQYLSPTQK